MGSWTDFNEDAARAAGEADAKGDRFGEPNPLPDAKGEIPYYTKLRLASAQEIARLNMEWELAEHNAESALAELAEQRSDLPGEGELQKIRDLPAPGMSRGIYYALAGLIGVGETYLLYTIFGVLNEGAVWYDPRGWLLPAALGLCFVGAAHAVGTGWTESQLPDDVVVSKRRHRWIPWVLIGSVFGAQVGAAFFRTIDSYLPLMKIVQSLAQRGVVFPLTPFVLATIYLLIQGFMFVMAAYFAHRVDHPDIAKRRALARQVDALDEAVADVAQAYGDAWVRLRGRAMAINTELQTYAIAYKEGYDSQLGPGIESSFEPPRIAQEVLDSPLMKSSEPPPLETSLEVLWEKELRRRRAALQADAGGIEGTARAPRPRALEAEGSSPGDPMPLTPNDEGGSSHEAVPPWPAGFAEERT